MTTLAYAKLSEAFENIDELNEKYINIQKDVSDFERKYKITDNNYNEINKDIMHIQSHPARRIQKEDFEEDPKLKQMKEDSQSIIMQNKFTISLGAIAVASMIILHSQL
jgi:uncharacterized coiled-coil DUF342 family protein